nr:ribonuclease H-like domain-containing protein [Tanacetum cinerariifolium]
MQFLMGLDEVYAPIRSIILTTDPIPDVKGAFATLSRDESHRGSQNSSLPKTRNSAFVARPNNMNNNWDNDQSTSNSFTNDQFKKLMALISDKSGSSSMPAILQVSKLNMTVGYPNGTKAVVAHVGSLRLTDQTVIHDVLVVPGYEVSLLSVHKLSKDNKYKVIFDDNVCAIQDFVQRTQVGTGNESNGLYFLNTGKKIVNNNIEICCLSKCIWHNRLGHPSDQVLNVLKHKLDFEKDIADNVCKVCRKAKQTRDPFSLSENQTKVFGEIVHLDVWGPYKVQSREGYTYFLTIVDDFFSTECKEYEMVFQNKNSLNFFNNDEDEYKSDDPYDDRRDKEPKISEGIEHIPSEGTKNTGFTRRDDGEHPDDIEPVEAVGGVEEDATVDEKYKISEGSIMSRHMVDSNMKHKATFMHKLLDNMVLKEVIICMIFYMFYIITLVIVYVVTPPHSSHPYYSLERNAEYHVPMRTTDYGIMFFVRSAAEFDSVYRGRLRDQIEDGIIIKTLQKQCYYKLPSLNLIWNPEHSTYKKDRVELEGQVEEEDQQRQAIDPLQLFVDILDNLEDDLWFMKTRGETL